MMGGLESWELDGDSMLTLNLAKKKDQQQWRDVQGNFLNCCFRTKITKMDYAADKKLYWGRILLLGPVF